MLGSGLNVELIQHLTQADAGKVLGRGQDSSPNFGEAISPAEVAVRLDVSTGYIQEAKKRM